MEFGRHYSLKDIGEVTSLKNIRRVGITVALVAGLAPAIASADGSIPPTTRIYPQCGGEVNGKVFPSDHLLEIAEFTDNSDPSKSSYLLLQDFDSKPDECGNPQ